MGVVTLGKQRRIGCHSGNVFTNERLPGNRNVLNTPHIRVNLTVNHALTAVTTLYIYDLWKKNSFLYRPILSNNVIVVSDVKLQISLFTITEFQLHHYTFSSVLLAVCNGDVRVDRAYRAYF